MPRMPRIVIPGVPHHVTRARQPPRGCLLRRRGQAAVLDVGGRCGGSLCAATPCSNRTPAGRRSVRRAPGENPRPHPPPPQTRPASQPKTEEEMILCPRNSSGVTAAPAARGPTPAFSRGSKSCSLAASRPAARADQGRDHEKIGIVSPDFPDTDGRVRDEAGKAIEVIQRRCSGPGTIWGHNTDFPLTDRRGKGSDRGPHRH